ncbi:hypothetical protein PtB15_4B73 [Puccinia triticina]|nr:hypothetical protein PtB15_4B73 [Puccinia triticina]
MASPCPLQATSITAFSYQDPGEPPQTPSSPPTTPEEVAQVSYFFETSLRNVIAPGAVDPQRWKTATQQMIKSSIQGIQADEPTDLLPSALKEYEARAIKQEKAFEGRILSSVASLSSTMKADIAGLKTDVATVKTDIAATKTDIAGLKADVAVMKTNIAGLKTNVATVKTDIAGLKTDVATVKTDIAGLKTDVATVKTDIAAMKTDIAGLKADVAVMKPSLKRLEQIIISTGHSYISVEQPIIPDNELGRPGPVNPKQASQRASRSNRG